MTNRRLVRHAALAGLALSVATAVACGGSAAGLSGGDSGGSGSGSWVTTSSHPSGNASGSTTATSHVSAGSSVVTTVCATLSCPIGVPAYGDCSITTGADGCPQCTCVFPDVYVPDVATTDTGISDVVVTDAPFRLPEAGTCRLEPGSMCSDPQKPNFYVCVLETAKPAPACLLEAAGNVVDTYCCP
jgi:hypothetical protein